MTQALQSPAEAVQWLRQRMAGGSGTLRTDSRRVHEGDAFIAWPGGRTDARRFVGAALAGGAAACLVEARGAEAFALDAAEPRVATLIGLKATCGEIAAAWFGEPGAALTLVAVTGTNGKTSTAWWTAQAMTGVGQRCGMIGTLGIGEPSLASAAPSEIVASGLTTPDPVTLQAGLRRLADAGATACTIEASSIGIAERRLAGTPITVAQFTNFTRDHLDYHGNMAEYWAAKRALFDWPGLRAAVVDVDDDHGAHLADELAQRGAIELWTTAVRQPGARLRAEALRYIDGALAFTLVEQQADGRLLRLPVRSALIGDFNARNLLLVLGALRALGVPLADAAAQVPRLTPVPGRMQRIDAGIQLPPGVALPELVVDYAHTPDALEKALVALRPLAATRGGRLWCVFGCGGNRDATKRPLMGAIAHRLADRVVLTSDNPRDERPSMILCQILAGIAASQDVAMIEDRRAAIGCAVREAAAEDVVLVAGKGHEDSQEVSGVKRPFSDAAVVAEALVARAGAAR